MTKPINTYKIDPIVHLAGAMSDGADDYITGMEAAGQRQIVQSTVIPRDRDAYSRDITDATYEALGFVFGDATDDLFQEVTLPKGWSRNGSDHNMWSHIVDQYGRERVAVFYKAAFYDRSAHASLTSVFGYVSSCAHHGSDVIFDYDWATPFEVAKAAYQLIERQQEYVDMYGPDQMDVPDRVAEIEAEIAKYKAIADVAKAKLNG